MSYAKNNEIELSYLNMVSDKLIDFIKIHKNTREGVFVLLTYLNFVDWAQGFQEFYDKLGILIAFICCDFRLDDLSLYDTIRSVFCLISKKLTNESALKAIQACQNLDQTTFDDYKINVFLFLFLIGLCSVFLVSV